MNKIEQLKPKVLVVGAGSPNADFVAEVLKENGIEANWTDQVKVPNLRLIARHNVVYGIFLQTCSRYVLAAKLLGRKTAIHFVGSDAYWFAREVSIIRQRYWRFVLNRTDLVFYVSPHLERLVGLKGSVLPFPIATEQFRKAGLREQEPVRDVLYYCPSGLPNERIYRLDWIIEYARSHPEQEITIIGNSSHPATYRIELQNVKVVPFVRRHEMPSLYRRHRRLIRMTTEDGLPRMVHEALLCGLSVTFNGREVTDVPKEREPSQFASTFLRAIEGLFDHTKGDEVKQGS